MVINPYIFKREPNTFIGGIAKLGGTGANAPILTAAELATTLGVSANNIKGFKVIGENVECKIDINYLPSTGMSIFSPENLTYFDDVDGHLTKIDNGMFVDNINLERLTLNGTTAIGTGGGNKITNTKLVELNFPVLVNANHNNSVRYNSLLEVISAPILEQNNGNSCFATNPNLNLIDFRKCKRFWNLNTNDFGAGVFTNSGVTDGSGEIRVHIDCKTANSGELDPNVLYLYNRNWTVNFYDDNGNFVETYNPNPELYTQNDACSIGANETESIGAGWISEPNTLVTIENSTESNWCLKFNTIDNFDTVWRLQISGLEIGETYEISLDGRAEDATGLSAGRGFIRTDVNNGWASLAYADIDSFNWQHKSFSSVATDTDAILEYYPSFTDSVQSGWSGFLDNISIKKIS